MLSAIDAGVGMGGGSSGGGGEGGIGGGPAVVSSRGVPWEILALIAAGMLERARRGWTSTWDGMLAGPGEGDAWRIVLSVDGQSLEVLEPNPDGDGEGSGEAKKGTRRRRKRRW